MIKYLILIFDYFLSIIFFFANKGKIFWLKLGRLLEKEIKIFLFLYKKKHKRSYGKKDKKVLKIRRKKEK